MTQTNRCCFLTPSYRGDLAQFALLRESIRLFAPTFPHVAVVHTEDYSRFKKRFGSDPHLDIVKTAEILPGTVERRRRKSGPRWLTGSWLWGPRIKGWHAQQLTKIYALAKGPYEAAIFLDSDVLICRPLSVEYFFLDGRLKLFRQRATNAESMDFDISTHDVIGNPLHEVVDLFDYVFHPACFRKSTAVTLVDELLRRRRTEERWIRYFIGEKRPSEYNLLGYSATVLEQCKNYVLTECHPTDLHHSVRFPEDRARFLTEMQNMLTQPKQFALIQSTLGIDPGQIAEAFHRLAAGQDSRGS
ncbi:MAG TPA: DUF6492 family protein [Steroidobacteraceae bacterium]